jgi:AsmA-like C-terminal region
LDKRGKPTKSGPRRDGVSFTTLYLPFSADGNFIRLKNVTVRGADMCATADGVVRKSDNALDVSGTVVPACGLSRAFNNVPLIGEILSGGNYNEGIFGVTYSIGGTLTTPQVQVNPLSALAPGIFRRLFDFNPKPAAQVQDNSKQK